MDIVNNSIEEFAAAMSDVDAVVFSAGAGGSGLDKTIMIDLDGAVKIMTAAEKQRSNVLLWSALSEWEEKKLHVKFKKILRLRFTRLQKNYADEWLKTRTELDWTIIHPGMLTDKESTGKVALASHVEAGGIPREDVAKVILETLVNDVTIRKEFEVVSGVTPIDEAVKNLKD